MLLRYVPITDYAAEIIITSRWSMADTYFKFAESRYQWISQLPRATLRNFTAGFASPLVTVGRYDFQAFRFLGDAWRRADLFYFRAE